MVQVTDLVLILVYIPQWVYQLLVWLYWLQDKEYRSDRFFDLLKSKDAPRKLGLWLTILKLLVLTLYLLAVLPTFFVFVTLIFCDFWVLINLVSEGLRRPIFTKRAVKIISIAVGAFLLLLATYFFGHVNIAQFLLLIELTPFLTTPLAIIWTGLITKKIMEKEKKEAEDKLTKLAPIVIGITGSYGKTTTKEFLAKIMSPSFSVLKSKANENSEFGIIRRINNDLNELHTHFICEMGAYKRGDISKLTCLVKPSMGVITGIENQHLGLFGSLENILKAKFELIEAIKRGGSAIFNLNSLGAKKLYLKAKKLRGDLSIWGYRKWDKKSGVNLKAIASYRLIKRDGGRTDFEVYFEKKKLRFTTNILGEHFLENITGSIITARLLGVPFAKIKKSLLSLELPDGTLNLKYLFGGRVVLIDDSGNASFKSFEAAISTLKTFPGVRTVVTPGIIELGAESNSIHSKLGKMMHGVVDNIYCTSESAYLGFSKGFGRNNLFLVNSPKKLIGKINSLKNKGEQVILLEGRQSKKLYDYIEEQI